MLGEGEIPRDKETITVCCVQLACRPSGPACVAGAVG